MIPARAGKKVNIRTIYHQRRKDPEIKVIQVIPAMMTHHQEDTERIVKTRHHKEGRIHQILTWIGRPRGKRRITRRAREQRNISSYQQSTWMV